MSIDVPFFGNLVLCAVFVAAAYTFAIAVVAGRSEAPRHLQAARWGTYATCAFVALAVCLLAYAFQTHDFRIRYVARYSDRSMPWFYLVASLWGGQDGSLLWWSFLLAVYTTLCTRSLRGRYPELQPYLLATLMSILMFFSILMLFAANPFFTSMSGAPPDGEGLNPLLQNYWMVIHPPTLYMGFVGWSIPFAFVMAALLTGRLHEEWIYASRRWTLAAWAFLATGNMLGALWSYEELGWGGYWAWDPVENAAFMPLLVATAYLHSIMIQERRGMLKVWNVFLLCLTFILTIFGTFLTRSGLIASVHSFARSDIGVYFIGYLIFLVVTCIGLLLWRLPKLRAQNKMDSMLSREFAFLLNNWILVGMWLFVLIATTFPLISEAVRGETVTVGPSYYNKWMTPLGLILLFLAGVGPLIAWRKATGKTLWHAFRWPLSAGAVALFAQVIGGASAGFPPFVHSEEIYETTTGRVLALIYGVAPAVSVFLCAFVLATVVQEFWRGTSVRRRSTGEPAHVALFRLVSKARRRYGGYIVHVGIVLMYLGFTGAAYDQEKEATLARGQMLSIRGYKLRYDQSRMEVDPNKRMIFTDLTVLRDGKILGRVSPAKFIYRTHPDMPTTEVAIRSNLREDLYVIMSSVNPDSKVGTFKVIVRPLVSWIWIGALLLLLGTGISISPTMREILGEAPARSPTRRNAAPAVASFIVVFGFSALFTATASPVQAQSSSLHAGSVHIDDPQERKLFERLLCQCGDCQRLALSTCACSWAENKRDELRARLALGENTLAIQESYRAQYGAAAIAIPSDRGLDRALWAVPVVALVVVAGGLFWLGRRWVRRNTAAQAVGANPEPESVTSAPKPSSAYDTRLDDELKNLES